MNVALLLFLLMLPPSQLFIAIAMILCTVISMALQIIVNTLRGERGNDYFERENAFLPVFSLLQELTRFFFWTTVVINCMSDDP